MKIFYFGILVAVFVFATMSVSQATLRDSGRSEDAARYSCPGYYDFSDTQGLYPGGDFDHWRAMQEERIGEALRAGNLSQDDHNRLERQLKNIESFHDQMVSLKSGTTPKHQEKMTQMESQLSGDISALVQKNCIG